MWQPRINRCKRYSMHGPASSVVLIPEQDRVVYGGNFEAQLPNVIRQRVERDMRKSVDLKVMGYLMVLGNRYRPATS